MAHDSAPQAGFRTSRTACPAVGAVKNHATEISTRSRLSLAIVQTAAVAFAPSRIRIFAGRTYVCKMQIELDGKSPRPPFVVAQSAADIRRIRSSNHRVCVLITRRRLRFPCVVSPASSTSSVAHNARDGSAVTGDGVTATDVASRRIVCRPRFVRWALLQAVKSARFTLRSATDARSAMRDDRGRAHRDTRGSHQQPASPRLLSAYFTREANTILRSCGHMLRMQAQADRMQTGCGCGSVADGPQRAGPAIWSPGAATGPAHPHLPFISQNGSARVFNRQWKQVKIPPDTSSVLG